MQVRKYTEKKPVGIAALISQCLRGHFLLSDSVSIRVLPLPILHDTTPHPPAAIWPHSIPGPFIILSSARKYSQWYALAIGTLVGSTLCNSGPFPLKHACKSHQKQKQPTNQTKKPNQTTPTPADQLHPHPLPLLAAFQG